MSKSVKIQDSPEFKAFKENFEATMDAMEKDPEFAQMKLPEEWERDFKETMESTWKKITVSGLSSGRYKDKVTAKVTDNYGYSESITGYSRTITL